MSNPFTIKQYLVYESLYSPKLKCNELGNSSRIISTTDTAVFNSTGYKSSEPLDIIELQNYISNELAKFIINVKIAKTCDLYGNALMMRNNLTFPIQCNEIFKEFSNETITSIRNRIIAGNPLAYTSRLGQGDQLFNELSYTDDYISKKESMNDKKPLCQRLVDMNNMMADFSIILKSMDTDEVKNEYKDIYNDIAEKFLQNMDTRTELDNRLKEIYNTEDSFHKESKLYLDSTIYTSILWTILATTIIFYIFKKM